MNWRNLKQNECPKCGHLLQEMENFYGCPSFKEDESKKICDFTISKTKFNEIIRSLYLPRKMHVPDEEENLAGLNNL